jgi:hypothetical protein
VFKQKLILSVQQVAFDCFSPRSLKQYFFDFGQLLRTKRKRDIKNYTHRCAPLTLRNTGRKTYCTLLWLQEKIGDDYKEVVQVLGRRKMQSSVVRVAREMSGFLRDFYEAVYAQDVQKIAGLRHRLKGYFVEPHDVVSARLLMIRQHLIDGLGSVTGLQFVGNSHKS